MHILNHEWLLRSFMEEDADSLSRHGSNPKIAATLRDGFPTPYTPDHARSWIRTALGMPHETYFVIVINNEPCGCIGFGLQGDVYRKSAEVAYWLAEPHWGKGITTWALRTISDYAFTNFDLVRLYASIFESNPASARVLEKAGYVLEGRLRKSVFKNGQLMDSLLYARIKG